MTMERKLNKEFLAIQVFINPLLHEQLKSPTQSTLVLLKLKKKKQTSVSVKKFIPTAWFQNLEIEFFLNELH